MAYSKEKKKTLGAFYTPEILSDFLARIVLSLCKIPKGSFLTVLDPATGDSTLLLSIAKIAQQKKMDYSLIGIDVDKNAINKSRKRFKDESGKSVFVNTDALYPYGCNSPKKGWNTMSKRYFPQGLDLIVSNPPWGAEIVQVDSLSKDFETAAGQFDIYDVFIETILTNLKEDGVYGIIVPDSIYCKEHQRIRELLLKKSQIKGIVRLGEGFFPEVNFSVSIIYGIKKVNPKAFVLCSHLSNTEKKMVLKGTSDLLTIVENKSIKVPIKQMIKANYSFTVDISPNDLPIIKQIGGDNTIKTYTTCNRGVELSKKGNVLQCPHCEKWFPEPRNRRPVTECPHCKTEIVLSDAPHACIISRIKNSKSLPLIVGEDVGRYCISEGRYIKTGFQGVNYKKLSLYEGVKVVVRKTGVGITAGIDYNNSVTNQVVYILKPRQTVNPLITAEVIAAILSSRLFTYLIIKGKGSIGWTSNPYLSQDDINSLPFPVLNFENNRTIANLKRITELVKKHSQVNNNISAKVDSEIERIIAELYGIGRSEYEVIFQTISQVEQMIPFRRLLNIKIEDIFKDGV